MKYHNLISTVKHGTPSIAAPHTRTLDRKIAQPQMGTTISFNHLTVNPQPIQAISQAGDRFEQEADRAASSIMGEPSGSPQFSTAGLNAPVVQRQEDTKPKSEGEKYQDAAKKVGEAFLETEPGKKIKDQATEMGKSFLETLPGKIITGAAAATAISVIAAKNASLPMQVPEIPLDGLAPGLSMKINYEGPVQKPTAASISFTYKFGGSEDKDKKPAMTPAEKYRADTGKMAGDMAKFQEGLKTPAEKKQDAAMDAFTRSKQGNLFAPLDIPGLKPKSETTLKMREDDTPVQKKAAPGTRSMGPTPAAVHGVLAQGGQPLDPATRAYMEPRFGQDFSHVRVHADARAADSAQSLNALAYTVGSHIVFGAGQFAPQSFEGKKLLAHEMTHVVQQTGAGGVQTRTSTPADAHERSADRAAADLVLGHAVQVPSGGNPPYLQRQERLQLTPPSMLRPGQPSNIHLGPNLQLGPHLLPDDITNIDGFLTLHGFSSSAQFQPVLDGAPTTLDAVTDRVTQLVLPIIPRDEVKQYVTRRFIGMTVRDLAGINIVVPPIQIPNIWAQAPAAPQATPEHAPITFTTAVNIAWHVNLTSPPGSSGDATLQFQIGEDAPLQRIFQLSYNINTQQVQVLVGGQATADHDLVDHLLKLSGFVQIVAGVAWTGSPASGTATVVQPSAGGQLTLTWHGVQFAVQASLSVTGTQGQPTTGEINVTPQITIPLERQPTTVHRTPSSDLTGELEIRDWVETSSYSQLERLPTDEKIRLVSVLVRSGTIVSSFADAIARIWRAATSSERQQLKRVIEPHISEGHTPEVQAQLRRLFSEP